jgi:hypothetical protein
MSNPNRVIVLTYDTINDTCTFTERNFTSQNPGPYTERSAPDYPTSVQASSHTGAMQQLGQVLGDDPGGF